MKFSIKKKHEFKPPALKLDLDVKEQIVKVALGSILDNIKRQVQVDGSPLKVNPPGYAKAKQLAGYAVGGSVLSLVAKEHRFVRPENWSASWTDKGVKITPNAYGGDPPLATLVENVQQRGYVGWFGVGEKGLRAIQSVLADWVARMMTPKG